MSQSANSTVEEVIITSFVRNIHAPFTFITVITPLCACLVTLLVVLFVFSTAKSRRRLIFRLNVIAICFALVLGVLSFIVSGNAILRPFSPVPESCICCDHHICHVPAGLLRLHTINTSPRIIPHGKDPFIHSSMRACISHMCQMRPSCRAVAVHPPISQYQLQALRPSLCKQK
ncbi:hypothetical protein F5141DRAFT_397100 [Pisolithus sp. B1]|nr:hypothetical protein F5141DRAFT_397100 [Pisolithus sp. B1]